MDISEYVFVSITHTFSNICQNRSEWSGLREQSRASLRVREMEVSQREAEALIQAQGAMAQVQRATAQLAGATAQLSGALARQQEIRQLRQALETDQRRDQARDNELISSLLRRNEGAPSPKRQKGGDKEQEGDEEMGEP